MAGISNESGVVDDGNLWRFEWQTSEIRPAILYEDMLPLVGL